MIGRIQLQTVYRKLWCRRIPQLIFYIALTIELLIVIVDKSNYINPIEGQLFRLTFLLFACKIVSTEYTWKERGLIVFFGIIGLISYKVTGKNDIIRIVTFVAACKGIPLKQMIRYAFYMTLTGCILIIFLAVTGIYGEMSLTGFFGRDMNYQEAYDSIARKGTEETRYTLGMGHPNALSCMYLMLCAMGIYVYADKMKWYFYLFLMLLNVGVYGLTDSKTSMLITTLLLIASFLMTYCKFLCQKKFSYVSGLLVFMLCIVFSVDAAANAVKVREELWNEYEHPEWGANVKLLAKIDSHISGRILSLTNSTNNDGTIETWSAFSSPNNMNYYFDMGWVKLFYRFGIIPGILYCIACVALLWRFYQKRDAFGLVIFTVLAVYSIVEAHLFSVYVGRNFLLMMMGSYFFPTEENSCG